MFKHLPLSLALPLPLSLFLSPYLSLSHNSFYLSFIVSPARRQMEDECKEDKYEGKDEPDVKKKKKKT